MESSPFSNRLNLVAFFVIACFVAHPTFALKPSHEADRLLMAAEDAFDNNERQKAAEHLQAARQLGVALPADFNFLYGKLLLQQNSNGDARRYLEQYVNREGSEGRFYRDALSLITQIEKKGRPKQVSINTSRGKAEIKHAGNGGSYVDHIQTLYATPDAARALTIHLNNLLKFYAYGDERVIQSNRSGKPSRHSIQYSEQGEIITFNKVGNLANSPYREDRFSVYGVNSIINYQCRNSSSSCWLYHPITSQKWLQIVRNEDVALEIAKALSQLIRDLQKNS